MCLRLKYWASHIREAIVSKFRSNDKPIAVSEGTVLKPQRCPTFYNDPTPEAAKSAPKLPKRSKKVSKAAAEDQSFEGTKSTIDQISKIALLHEDLHKAAIELWKDSLALSCFTKFHPEARAAACVLVASTTAMREVDGAMEMYDHIFHRYGFPHYTYATEADLMSCIWLLSSWVDTKATLKYSSTYVYVDVMRKGEESPCPYLSLAQDKPGKTGEDRTQ